MSSTQEFFDGLPSRVSADRIEGMNNTYVFEIEGAGVWTVAVAWARSPSPMAPATPTRPSRRARRTSQKIVAGEQNPTTAYMTGKLKIKGDMGAAMKLQKLF